MPLIYFIRNILFKPLSSVLSFIFFMKYWKGFAIINYKNRKIITINEIFLEKTGYKRSDVVGKKYTDFIHVKDLNGALLRTNRTASIKYDNKFSNKWKCKDGKYVYISWNCIVYWNYIFVEAKF